MSDRMPYSVPHERPIIQQQLPRAFDSSYFNFSQRGLNGIQVATDHPSPIWALNFHDLPLNTPGGTYTSATAAYGHSHDLGTHLPPESCASGSHIAEACRARRPGDATYHAGAVRSNKRGREVALKDVVVHIEPCTVRLPCGWHGCNFLISPDRMGIKHHFVNDHDVPTGEELVPCAYPTCSKDVKADSLWQHWITHLGVKIECTVCHLAVAARLDAFKRHLGGGCRGHGRFITIGDGTTIEGDPDSSADPEENKRCKKPRIC